MCVFMGREYVFVRAQGEGRGGGEGAGVHA